MQSCDFLVVGAGIAGASAAYELAAGGSAIVLEREEAPGYHTTGRSAAQFLESYGNDVIRAITRASRAFYDAPPEGFAGHALLSPRPSVYLAREDQLDDLADFQKDAGADTAALTAAEVAELVPVVRPGYAAAGLIEESASDIDVHALHQGYLKGLRRRGGQVVTRAEVTAARRTGGLWQVETAQGTFAAPVLVNAAGAWADTLGRLAGAEPIGLQPKRRTAITFDGPEGSDCRAWPLVADIAESFYFKPESGRLLASPGDETPMEPCDVQPEELDIAVTVDRIERATTLKVRRIAHKWAGLRSFVADKSLVIGFDEAVEGLFWLAGQGGYGIQTAPAAARCAAALATGTDLPDDVAKLGLTAEAIAPARLRPRVLA
ncbi:FAD-binding oxidoreductase [Pelagibius sp.]|uniref:NAD(P)/FAD-dependent oxidoreductase n=1 Tax=Pelagibius sp. TaxID=1931238 RepID=UPI00260A376F|nr:FAD-binding oxidoreductase [Pelagibius sp.]